MLDLVQEVDQAGRRIQPANRQVSGVEHLVQPVADQVDDALETDPGGHALLDAIDQRQFARAPLELRRALGQLAFQTLLSAQVGQRDRRLWGQGGEQVAVAVVQAAEQAFEVGVEIAQQLLLRDERSDQTAALVDVVGAFGAVPQAGLARAPGLIEPGRDGLQQRIRRFAFWHLGAGDVRAVGRLQHKQHPLRAQQLGHFLDQEGVQGIAAGLFVQPQAGVHQALDALSQVGRALQVGGVLHRGQRRRGRPPG